MVDKSIRLNSIHQEITCLCNRLSHSKFCQTLKNSYLLGKNLEILNSKSNGYLQIVAKGSLFSNDLVSTSGDVERRLNYEKRMAVAQRRETLRSGKKRKGAS